MVIQRIYVQQQPQPPTTPTDSTATNAAVNAQRPGHSDSDKTGLAATLDSAAVGAPQPVVSIKRTPSTSTSRTVSRLLAQTTGGSLSGELSPGGPGSSRPSSPLEGIRAPNMTGVLKPSDFAKRKAAFMKAPSETTTKFHAELERRYSNAPAPLEVKELSQKNDVPGRGTFVIPKLRSASAHSPASSTFLAPSKIITSSLSASPERSPTDLPSSTPTTVSTPKVEIQVIELNKRLIDSTVENKTLAAEISNMETQMNSLKDRQQETEAAKAKAEAAVAAERHVPKEQFDALVKDTERKAKELEEIEKRAEESRKQLEALTAQAAKLASKEKAADAEAKSQQPEAAKEELEKAVERLREQVEVATRQSSDVVTRKMSSSSRVSERYAPSNTRVALGRRPRADRSEAGTPTADRKDFDDARTIVSITSTNNRHSQIIHVAPAEPLPERDDIQRSIKSYYTESVRSPVSVRSPTFLPPIKQSDSEVSPSTDALSRDMAAIMEGFSTDVMTAGSLSLTAPAILTAPSRQSTSRSRPSVSPSLRPMSTVIPQGKAPLDTPSLRSKPSAASLRGTTGKKKGGWISLFKVKLPGSGSDDHKSSHAENGPPTLAPISTSTPISFNP